MHEHAQTWSVLKTLYSSTGGPGTTATTLAPSTKNTFVTGSHDSGGGLSTTGNTEPAAGKVISQLTRLSLEIVAIFGGSGFKAFGFSLSCSCRKHAK